VNARLRIALVDLALIDLDFDALDDLDATSTTRPSPPSMTGPSRSSSTTASTMGQPSWPPAQTPPPHVPRAVGADMSAAAALALDPADTADVTDLDTADLVFLLDHDIDPVALVAWVREASRRRLPSSAVVDRATTSMSAATSRQRDR
jgi:hypothetical protein